MPTTPFPAGMEGSYEPGNGSSLAIAALDLDPGEWPGTSTLTSPVLLVLGTRAYAFEAGPGQIAARWAAEKLGTTWCDATAALEWLLEYERTSAPGEELFTISGPCECGRHRG